MKCAYANCSDTIANPLVCKGCNQVTYCSNNCRVQDFYKGHNKVCKTKSPIKPAASPTPPPQERSQPSPVKPSEPPQRPQKPSPLSSYDISSKTLGSGAYGEVKLAKHIPTNTRRAIKIINKQSLEDEKLSLDIIHEEISTHQQLSHENIITFIEHFEDTKFIYIVLEYAEGGTLFEKIKKDEKIPETESKALFKQTVAGINYLHSNEKIHRDLKPENILLTKSGCVKICDLGWCGKGGECRSTFCGTLDYMAPEMIRGQPHSYEVDVWALGVLLYEMIHGYAPFQGIREPDKIQNIVQGRLVFEDWVSAEAKDLIQKMIKVNPKDRFTLSQVLSHAFFTKIEAVGVEVGAEFRYYVQNYGMDDGVVEEVKKNECLVGFKKSGMKIKLQVEEVKRRINRKMKNEGESVEKPKEGNRNVGEGVGIMEDIGAKLRRLMQEEELEEENKSVEKKIGGNKGEEVKGKSDEVGFKGFGEVKIELKAENIEKSVENVKKSEKNEEKSGKIEEKSGKIEEKYDTKVRVVENVKKSDKIEVKSVKIDEKSDSKVRVVEKVVIENKPAQNFLKPEKDFASLTSAIEKPLSPTQKSLNFLPTSAEKPNRDLSPMLNHLNRLADEEFDSQINAPNPLQSPNSIFLRLSQLEAEEKLSSTTSQPKILSSLQPIHDSSPKSFSKPTSQYPQLLKSSNFPVPQRSESPAKILEPATTQPDINKEYNIYSSLDAYIKAPIARKRGKNPQRQPKRDKSLDKTLEKFKEKYSDKPNTIFEVSEQKGVKNEDRPPSPKFANEEKESSSDSEENVFMKKLRQNFKENNEKIEEKPEKNEKLFPFAVSPEKSPKPSGQSFPILIKSNEKSPVPKGKNSIREVSPKFPILSDSDDSSPRPAPKQISPKKPVSKITKKTPPKSQKKLKDFESAREILESKHFDYYNEIEGAWIDQKDVIQAEELSENELGETSKPRTFSQYDEVLKNPPSIVGNFEDFSYSVSREKLESQKKELEEMISKLDKEKNIPIRIRRDKKQKDGFLSWLGDIIGCSDRY